MSFVVLDAMAINQAFGGNAVSASWFFSANSCFAFCEHPHSHTPYFTWFWCSSAYLEPLSCGLPLLFIQSKCLVFQPSSTNSMFNFTRATISYSYKSIKLNVMLERKSFIPNVWCYWSWLCFLESNRWTNAFLWTWYHWKKNKKKGLHKTRH